MDSFGDFARRLCRYDESTRVPKKYIRDAQNPLDFLSDSEFLLQYSFPKSVVTAKLLKIVSPVMRRSSNRGLPIPPLLMLLTALRFYSTGSYQVVCGDLHGLSQASVSIIIYKISKIFCRRLPHFIKIPTTEPEVSEVTSKFFEISGFPGVIGAVDGTHVKIKNPGGPYAEAFRNGKGDFSINVQIIADASLRILDIVARRPGSCQDARMFDNSSIRTRFENGQVKGLLVGDSEYPCREYLFTPILEPSNCFEERYNGAHSRARNVVQRTIGVLKQRFPCLKRGMGNSLQRCAAVICAVAVLHNIAIKLNLPQPEVEIEVEDVGSACQQVTNENAEKARQQFIIQHFC